MTTNVKEAKKLASLGLGGLLVAAAMAASPLAVSAGQDEQPARAVPDIPGVSTAGELQHGLERLVRGLGYWRYVESGNLALGLLDITDLDAPRYAALNANEMMYAASLPKIAILLGAYVKIANGELLLTEHLREEMTRMIRFSDNACATSVLGKVGRDDLIEILTSERLRLYDPEANGGLWVGKDYARQGAYHRDPLHNLSHGATIHQVLRFFYMLERGDLVDPKACRAMKEILSKPAIPHKFVAGLKDRPGIELFRKSGTWRDFHADAALVEAGDHRYVIAGLVKHPDGGKWLARLAGGMHDLVVTGPEEPPSRRAAVSLPH